MPLGAVSLLISVVFFGVTIYVRYRLCGLMPGSFEGFIARSLIFLRRAVLILEII
jgi:hypothetical protein